MHVHISLFFEFLGFLTLQAEVGLHAVTDQLTKVLIVTKYFYGERWNVICFLCQKQSSSQRGLAVSVGV